MESPASKKPHVVCFPYPAQGHINPMMKLAKILHSRGFHITFVNTEYNHSRLLRARGSHTLDGVPSFRFELIPDGLHDPTQNPDVTQDVVELAQSTERNFEGYFRKLIAKLNDTASYEDGVPPVSCIVSDITMYFAHEMSQEMRVPSVTFFPNSAVALLGLAQFERLFEWGIVPFKDDKYMENGDLDLVLDWVPGALNGIRLKDLPSFMRITDSNDFVFHYVIRLIQNLKKASFILLNSFDELENDALQALAVDFPPLYPIGPLQLLLDPIEKDETKSITSNLWKDDPHCIDWLDSQNFGSVVYVNFGSITVMTNEQFVEFAWGLANSNQPFLWITRPDLILGKPAIFSPEFLAETKDRGLITSWCDQERVLAHTAVGGFLTHNGWNSTLESIYNGVPMICWPFFADQQTNCWFCCTKWDVGTEIDTNVKREAVEKQVKELMVGNKGKEMKRKAMEWKKLAHEAVMPTSGSSYSNLENAIKVLVSQS